MDAVVYHLCRECLYTDADDRCLEQCTEIKIVAPEDCQSEMHPLREDDDA